MRKPKRKYGRYRRFSPKKGSKTRTFLLMALRPDGVSTKELIEAGISYNLGKQLKHKMHTEYGYNVIFVASGTHKIPSRYYLKGRFYDKYRKSKDFAKITNIEIERSMKAKKLTSQDARRIKLLREINS